MGPFLTDREHQIRMRSIDRQNTVAAIALAIGFIVYMTLFAVTSGYFATSERPTSGEKP